MNIVYVFVADVFCVSFRGLTPESRYCFLFHFMNIVYVFVADVFVCVIPGLDPGIQVMVQIKMSLWDNGDHPAPV